MQPEEYGSFLVRLWYARQDGDRQRPGHAEVEHIQSGSRLSFHTCDTLLAFLQQAIRPIRPLNDRGMTVHPYICRSAMVCTQPQAVPVFMHVASEANTRGNQTIIDHPMTNNDPQAILIVTRRESLLCGQHDHSLILPTHAESFCVAYSSRAAKWLLLQPEGCSVPPGAAFNVLVFKV
jgi:hypothetical protein